MVIGKAVEKRYMNLSIFKVGPLPFTIDYTGVVFGRVRILRLLNSAATFLEIKTMNSMTRFKELREEKISRQFLKLVILG